MGLKNDFLNLFLNEDSKGFTEDYGSAVFDRNDKSAGVAKFPSFNRQKAMDLVNKDSVVRAAFISIADSVVQGDHQIVPENDKSGLEDFQKRSFRNRTDLVLKEIALTLQAYNNCFVEIVKDEQGKFTYWNVLDTKMTQIRTLPNGDIVEYYQDENTDAVWSPDEIVHIKLDDYTSATWSRSSLEALYKILLTKQEVLKYIYSEFEMGMLKKIFLFERNTQEAVVKSTLSQYFKKTNVDPVTLSGDAFEVKQPSTLFEELPQLLELLDWCNNEILKVIQVPSIVLGESRSDGRSDGAELRTHYETRIKSLRKLLESYINYELLPKSGFERLKFSFGLLGESHRKEILDNVMTMRNAQFTEEAIVEYMESQGIRFKTKNILKDSEELAQMSNEELGTGNESIKGNKNKDSSNSRQRQNKDELSEANQEVQK